jgi:hypothetical protein
MTKPLVPGTRVIYWWGPETDLVRCVGEFIRKDGAYHLFRCVEFCGEPVTDPRRIVNLYPNEFELEEKK